MHIEYQVIVFFALVMYLWPKDLLGFYHNLPCNNSIANWQMESAIFWLIQSTNLQTGWPDVHETK